MSISLPRAAKQTALIIAGIGIAHLCKKIKERSDYAEFAYSSMFGEAEVFTLESESGVPVRVLNVGGGFQSATYLGAKRFEPVFEYYRAFDHMFDNGNQVTNVLMIGGGGFSYPKHLLTSTKDVNIDVVEADPVIVEIARKHFYVKDIEKKFSTETNPRFHIHISDGRAFIGRTKPGTYDAIINDAFDGANPIVGLLTSTALSKAKQALTQGGLYMLNAVIAEDDRKMLKTYMEILLEEFSNAYAIRCTDEEFAGEDNWLIIASDEIHYFNDVEIMIAR